MKAKGYIIALALLVALLGGCCGGGGSQVQNTTKTTTLGQELNDLKKAYDSGAITEDQYNKMKKEIINKSEGK
jgi:uncharacterized membrane protein